MSEILFREESYKIVGACFEVYKSKGCGFTEQVYQECLQIEFELQGIPFVSQPKLQLGYKGRTLEQFFKPDFICFDKIILEIKAVERLLDVYRAQCLNYLSAINFDLAIIANFGHFPKLEYERIANTINRGTRPSIYSRRANHIDYGD
jgi:GxxExxY protein